MGNLGILRGHCGHTWNSVGTLWAYWTCCVYTMGIEGILWGHCGHIGAHCERTVGKLSILWGHCGHTGHAVHALWEYCFGNYVHRACCEDSVGIILAYWAYYCDTRHTVAHWSCCGDTVCIQ